MIFYNQLSIAFLVLGCFYFLIMGVRQTIEVWKFISHEIGTMIAIRRQQKASQLPGKPAPAGVTRPPLSEREKLFPKK